MTVELNTTSDCCDPVCDTTVVNTPGPVGPQGNSGNDGADGANGVSGFSVITGGLTVPEVGQHINPYLDNMAIWSVGMYAYVEGSGHYYVKHLGEHHIVCQRLGYPNDPGSTGDMIPAGTVIVPTGSRGPAGATGDAGTLLSNKGEILTHSGSEPLVQGGAHVLPDMFLAGDESKPTGLSWKQISFSNIYGNLDLSTQASGELNPSNLAAITGMAAGDMIYYDGSEYKKITAGTSGQSLQMSGGVPSFVTPSAGLSVVAKADITLTLSGSTILNSTASNRFNIASSGAVVGAVGSGTIMTITLTAAIDTTSAIINVHLDDEYTHAAPYLVGEITSNSIELSMTPTGTPPTLSFRITVLA